MIAEYRTKGQLAIGMGLLCNVGRGILGTLNPPQPLYWSAVVATACVCAYACAMYAKAKGFTPLFAVLGPLLVVGLVIVILLPDLRRNPLLDNEKRIQ